MDDWSGFGLDLPKYLVESNRRLVWTALRASFAHPGEFLFLVRVSFEQMGAARRRARLAKRGKQVPSFLIASITDRCNLSCTGCYAHANRPSEDVRQEAPLATVRWGALFHEAHELGIGFVLLAGGEPMMRMDVLEQAAQERRIVFPVFTNGTLIDDASVRFFHRHRNLVPILSLEGDRDETDGRRGAGTHHRLQSCMETFWRKGIFFGVSITVTTRNLEAVTSVRFIDELLSRGCGTVLFIEYVPVTPDSLSLAPGDNERKVLEDRLRFLRASHRRIPFLSFPGDEKYLDGCLAAGRGFFHINPEGGAEPCPFSPYSDTNLKDATILEALDSHLFRKLNQDGLLRGEHQGGCLLFERENRVKAILSESAARPES
jgi:MoaA/NifB/PqqE/SkfB family radical SAM enzyme